MIRSRYLLPLLVIAVALALVLAGTYELAHAVLPFDWTTAASDVAPGADVVQLP